MKVHVRRDSGRAGEAREVGCVLFDWGNTLMVDLPGCFGPMASWPRVEAVAHAQETLGQLRAAGWHIALATNAADSDEDQIRIALARAGLDDLIDRVYCLRGVGYAKPSPEFFAFIIADLGLMATDLVMVGDNFRIDVEGANRSGIRAVWLCPGAADARGGENWRMIGSLAELPALLEAWTEHT